MEESVVSAKNFIIYCARHYQVQIYRFLSTSIFQSAKGTVQRICYFFPNYILYIFPVLFIKLVEGMHGEAHTYVYWSGTSLGCSQVFFSAVVMSGKLF